MQDRYVGDVGDFGKYALLRALGGSDLAAQDRHTLGVVWMLFPDEQHNNDGRHVSYLDSKEYRALDPHLFDELKSIVESQKRSVAQIEQRSIFAPNTVYFGEPVFSPVKLTRPAFSLGREEQRENWYSRGYEAVSQCKLIFLDPDNGIEIRSVNKRHPKAGKYIFWDEITPFLERGQSAVVYHHTNRTAPVRKQIGSLVNEFANRLPKGTEIHPLVFRRGSCRIFWILATEQHRESLSNRMHRLLENGWDAHFQLANQNR